MITYENNTLRPETLIAVRLNGKRVGVILKVKGHDLYYYKPDGGKAGESMASIAAVKRSLEGTE